MVPLNEVRGAEKGAAMAVPSRARPMVLASSSTDGVSSLAACSGLVRLLTTPRPSSSSSRGSRPNPPSSPSASGGASASRLHRCEIRLDPDTPSTVAWCIFENTAILSPSYPSITHISHSGRDRSSGSPARWPASSTSSSYPPGCGRASRCTCRSMSKCESLTQIGWSSLSGTLRSLRVNAGTSCTRLSISSRIASNEYGAGIVLGSSTIRPHTCISCSGVSR